MLPSQCKSDGLSYDDWMQEVDAWVQSIMDFPVSCISEWDSRAMYDENLSSQDGAKCAIARDEILYDQSKSDGVSYEQWLSQVEQWELVLTNGEGIDAISPWNIQDAYEQDLTAQDAVKERIASV
jgi:hypothetical protein